MTGEERLMVLANRTGEYALILRGESDPFVRLDFRCGSPKSFMRPKLYMEERGWVFRTIQDR